VGRLEVVTLATGGSHPPGIEKADNRAGDTRAGTQDAHHAAGESRVPEQMRETAANPLSSANDLPVRGLPPAAKFRCPMATTLVGKRNDGASTGQCPGHSLAGKWFDVAGCIAKQKQAIARNG